MKEIARKEYTNISSSLDDMLKGYLSIEETCSKACIHYIGTLSEIISCAGVQVGEPVIQSRLTLARMAESSKCSEGETSFMTPLSQVLPLDTAYGR